MLLSSRVFQSIVKQEAAKKVDLQSEPMLSSVLYGLQLSNYLNLRKKARILVPESATLIGIPDDDGILNEDEVFVQIRPDNFSDKKDYGHESRIL